MGQDPNQPYPGNVPPQGNYQGGYQQQGAYSPPPQYPPNTGYQQPGGYQYQQPYGQPGAGAQYNAGHPNGPTSTNMDPNVAAGLSYVLGWITGLIFFLIEKQNRFVRFNAMQSIVLYGATTIFYIALGILSTALVYAVPILGCLFGLIEGLVGLGVFVLWIICLINAFQGKYFKIPVIGDYAERWSGGGVTPPTYS